ncbi:carboxyl-terminal processing protease CtpC [Crocosphaera sp.]|uniref:carboxyl-terminal processing protease CtpC n=1 Tax=Crocosphaera sp. TaxID=2729996 RepID=UPI0026057AEC|nr:carboxyl-terminal processing protease CtpC [Crocosphaera sp.]MDJ0580344.1 S41 family peptidase [Crocosphaera sp.]
MVNYKKGLVLGATAAVLTTIAVTGAGLRLPRSVASLQDNPKRLVDEVWQVINDTYVDGTFNQVDWRAVRQEYVGKSKTYNSKEEAYKAIREMLEQLGDPYTRFMDPEEFKNMQIDTSGELTGVGIQITKDEETKELTVVAPIEDTPAFEAGILAKDVITKINGKTTEGMEVEDAVKLIRGKPGSKVTLTIRRAEEEFNYPIIRARIELHPVKARIEETPSGKVGYIRLTQFSAQASKEMRDAIREAEAAKVNGYILDLRSNPGGLLYSSVEIARMWLDEGRIVSTVSRNGEVEAQRATNRALTDKPLVIMVDGGSASASEILSGALQDNNRATLVGTKTFGKGLVQSVRRLGDGTSGLAVTIAKYLTPSGRDINKQGIEPDIIVELTEQERKDLQQERDKIGDFGDPQFEKAYEELEKEIAKSRGTNARGNVR